MAVLNGRVAIVTGAGRGIGRATALRLAAEGAKVALVSRTESELKDVESEICGLYRDPQRALAIEMDLADEDAALRIFETAEARLGAPDILINNAGIFAGGKIEEFSTEDWDHTFLVNVRGVFLCCREAFRRMHDGGCIVNISSLAGIRGTTKFPGFAAYTASKFAVVGLTEALAEEGRGKGIRVNCVAPGAVDTLMLKQAAPFLKTQTMPDDIAGVILSLCDPSRSRVVTGTVVEVFSNGPASE